MRSLRRTAFFIVVFMSVEICVDAQQVQVNRQNRTIAVTAEESVTADPDIAVVTVGYQNYGSTQQKAYQTNIRVGGEIVNALQKSGIEKHQIETGKLRLERAEPDEKWTPEMRRQRQFETQQSWKIRIAASDAGKVVDVAMAAGANKLEDVDWAVSDPVALQAKASGAALAKARSIAEQMAKGLGAKLGELVYASNESPALSLWAFARRGSLQTMASAISAVAPAPEVTLFPQKVKQDATVYAVFAIE